MKESDHNKKNEDEDQEHENHGVIYLLVHPAYPITNMHYFPTVSAFVSSAIPAALLHHFEPANNPDDNYENSTSYFNSMVNFSDILFTSFFAWVLLSNLFIGRAPDRESNYDPPRDKAAIGLNAGFSFIAAGGTAFMSLFRPLAHGLGEVATGIVSQGAAVAVGGANALTNERILWNHYEDRTPNHDGYMRLTDALGCRGEASITRVAEIISSYGFWIINLNLGRIHLTDATRVAFETGINHAQRFSIDLLVTFMNDLLFYAQSTADVSFISRTLQALGIADSSGSTRGTHQGFDPDEKPDILKAGDKVAEVMEDVVEDIAEGAGNIAHQISSTFHHLGDEIGEMFHHDTNKAPIKTSHEAEEETEDRKLTVEEYDELHGLKPTDPPAEENDALQEEADTLGAVIWQIFEGMAFLQGYGEEAIISTREIGTNTNSSISDSQTAQVEEHHGFFSSLIHHGHIHNAVSVATDTNGLIAEERAALFPDNEIISANAILTMASTMPAGSRFSINLPNNLQCRFCVVHKDKLHTKKIKNMFSEGRDGLSEHITAYHFCDHEDGGQEKVLLKMKMPIEGTENYIQIEIIGQPSHQGDL